MVVFIMLTWTAFAFVGGGVGYFRGYDRGFDEALEIYDTTIEELRQEVLVNDKALQS